MKGVIEIVNALIKAYEANVAVNLSKIKSEISRKHKLSYIPKLVDIIAAVPADYKAKLLPYIKAKPVRTASGVAVVAVMSKPHRCPHIALTGNVCVYCPGKASLFLCIYPSLPPSFSLSLPSSPFFNIPNRLSHCFLFNINYRWTRL